MKTLFTEERRARLIEDAAGLPRAIDILGGSTVERYRAAGISRIPNAFVVYVVKSSGERKVVARHYFQDDKPRAKRHARWNAKSTLAALKRTLGLTESSVRDRILAWLNTLGDPLTVYRAYYVPGPDSIQLDRLGRFWTAERDRAHSPFGKLDRVEGAQYVVKAKVRRSDVNESETLSTMQRYPEEREVRLNAHARVQVLSIISPDGREHVVRKVGNVGSGSHW